MKSTKLSPDDLTSRLLKVRCLLLDVDGVLTDGRIYLDGEGREQKAFDIQDGHGVAMAKEAGLLVGLISGRASPVTQKRAAQMGIDIVLQGSNDKWAMVEQVRQQHRLGVDEICFVGDDVVDAPVLRRVGLAVAVANAVPEVQDVAHYVTERRGGRGAVREVIDLLLKTQGKWDAVTARYLQ